MGSVTVNSSPSEPTTTIVWPTGITEPSLAKIFKIVPSVSVSNSTTALSVSISAIGSFLLTVSPS